MPEKDPCHDCPISAVCNTNIVSDPVSQVRVRHRLNTMLSEMPLPASNLTERAVDKCRHPHRWGEDLGFDATAVESLKRFKKSKN